MTQNWQGNSNKNNIWLLTKVMDATKWWDNVFNMLTEKYVKYSKSIKTIIQKSKQNIRHFQLN